MVGLDGLWGTRLLQALAVGLVCSCGGDVAEGGPAGAGEEPEVRVVSAPTNPVDTVRITLDEYSIGMPSELPAGETVISLESVGFEEHNLLFILTETDSLVWGTEQRLSPYEKRTVTIDLVPGAYTVVCDFSGHEGRGMFTELRVTDPQP